MNKLYVVSGKDERQSFDLKERTIYIGRSPENDIQIKDNYVSRKHLMLRRLGNRYFIKDLRSKNGTFINGNQIRPGTEVEAKEGVTIVIGMSVICLGERVSEEVLPLINSISPSKEFGDTDTLNSKKDP